MTSHPVAIVRQARTRYPVEPPYHPPRRYEELADVAGLDPTNDVFDSVRETLRLLGYDAANYGTPEWNPLGWLVRPGDTVFLKPNMIAHRQKHGDGWDFVITHGSVVRAVIDYVYRALEGRGRILLGDAPQEDSLWEEILARMALGAIRDHYRERHGFEIEILDLRDLHHVDREGIYVATRRLPGDPLGGVAVDLAGDSMLAELDGQGKRYYGAYYDWEETNRHHSGGRHEYRISKSPLLADVFIGLPKLKTHKKCGFTANLKGLVGINAEKNWLPHYAFGSPESGGDQFASASPKGRLENWVVLPAKKLLALRVPLIRTLARRTKGLGYGVFGDTERVVRSGNWHGNDTVWRMSLDLNRILLYGNSDGTLRAAGPRKRFFSLVDGIVAMEGNGPVAGLRRETGLLVAGANPVAVDAVCARLMGFDPARLPILRRAFEAHRYPLIEGDERSIVPVSAVEEWNRPLAEWRPQDTLRFRPHFAWTHAIEWTD